jgi:hypothetical protein
MMTLQTTLSSLPPTHRLFGSIGARAANAAARFRSFDNLGDLRDGARANRLTLVQSEPAGEEFPTPAYGSVWLVSAGDSDPSRISPLVLHALGVADAVIHDPGIPAQVLDLVKPPRYREAAEPRRAIERSIKLAEEGWRVVRLVGSSVVERAIETAINLSERDIPLHVVLNADEISGAGLDRLLIHQLVPLRPTAANPSPMLLASPSAMAGAAETRRPPVSFWMSGLAG